MAYHMQPSILMFVLALVHLLSACAGIFHPEPDLLVPAQLQPGIAKRTFPHVAVVKSDDYVIVIAKPGDTLQSLAQQFLGDPSQYWIIADFNDLRAVVPGQEVVIPLKTKNSIGVYANGYQMVPILSYSELTP